MSEASIPELPNAQRRAWILIAATGRFDPINYLDRNPDVAAAGVDPLVHYVEHGAREGRDPNNEFDTAFYLAQNSDVAAAGVNPFAHFIEHGEKEGRLSHPGAKAGTGARRGESAFPPVDVGMYQLNGLAQIAEEVQRSAIPIDLAPRPQPDLYSPTISLIFPVYNTAPRYLLEAIQSVRAQTYDDWEICLVDDCSTSQETIDALDELRADPRIRMSRLDRNGGIAQASHAALLMASGDYVGFLDHDDILLPSAFAEVVQVLRDDRAVDFIYSDHALATEQGLPRHVARKPAWSPEMLLSTNYIIHFKLIRRALLLELGGIEHERPNVQDLGVSLRLLAAGAKVRHLDKILYLWRDHGGSVASSSAAKEGIEKNLVAVYDDHDERRGSAGRHYWPRRFRRTRTGVFAIDFSKHRAHVAVVVMLDEKDPAPAQVRSRLGGLIDDQVSVHFVTRTRAVAGGDAAIRWFKNEFDERAYFAGMAADHVILCRGSARWVGPHGWRDLSGYLARDDGVGLVGAKTLDDQLTVIGGGLLLSRLARYALIAGDEPDVAPGHWFTAQIASNVDAIHSSCFATHRDVLASGPGLRWNMFGDFADVALSQAVVATGRRVVFNPWVKMIDIPTPPDRDANRSIGDMARVLTHRRVYREFIRT